LGKNGKTIKSSHLDKMGNAKMVNVKSKDETERFAKAYGKVSMNSEAYELLKSGYSKKGDIFSVARIAGIMSVKKTHELIPLCHNLRISSVKIDFRLVDTNKSCEIVSEVEGIDRTGFEMEALTAVSVSALTIYDMLKSVDRGITISKIYLLEKSGGKSGHYINKNY